MEKVVNNTFGTNQLLENESVNYLNFYLAIKKSNKENDTCKQL